MICQLHDDIMLTHASPTYLNCPFQRPFTAPSPLVRSLAFRPDCRTLKQIDAQNRLPFSLTLCTSPSTSPSYSASNALHSLSFLPCLLKPSQTRSCARVHHMKISTTQNVLRPTKTFRIPIKGLLELCTSPYPCIFAQYQWHYNPTALHHDLNLPPNSLPRYGAEQTSLPSWLRHHHLTPSDALSSLQWRPTFFNQVYCWHAPEGSIF